MQGMTQAVRWGPDVLIASLPVIGGAIVGAQTSKDINGVWYESLEKPPWQPPAILFPIVWTVLYVLMGVAFALAVRHRNDNVFMPWALAAFIVQLLLNYSWSIVFFRWRALAWSVAIILLLIAAIVVTIILFYLGIGRLPALLLVPYLVWVIFATSLNFDILQRNPKQQ